MTISNAVFTEEERNFALSLFARVRVATCGGRIGVDRPSYGHGETDALNIIAEEAEQRGLRTRVDDAANLLMTVDGEWPDGMVAIGSHLDAVPRGGNYDGLAGVVAALLVVQKAKIRRLKTPVVGIGLRGEESAWFGIPYMGSKAALGKLSKDDLWHRFHEDLALGTRMGQCGALVTRIERGERILPAVSAFWELHIEQGPVLVDEELPVGIVTAIRGNVRAPQARMFGQAGHSGTTPHKLRKDAVLRFAEMLVAAEEYRAHLHEQAQDIVMTCGMVGTVPEKHAMTTIADEVRFSLDVRSTNMDIAKLMFAYVQKYAGDTVDWGTVVETPSMTVNPETVARARRAAYQLNVPCMSLPSGAGHDAVIFDGAGIPSGMVFVRNRHGSHNPHEDMDIDDFMLGVETLYRTIASDA
jgi:N-carbamoyl-L-amino-acid hydrolase